MKTMNIVSFRTLISTFYLLKSNANDAWIRISQFEFFYQIGECPMLLLAVTDAM